MTDIWIVIVEDRHTDVDALPFSTGAAAVAYARQQARANTWHPGADWFNPAPSCL